MTAELAIKQLVNDNKIPTIAPAASDELVVPVSAYVWQTAPLSSQIVNTCLAFLNQQGKTSVAMLFDTRSAFAVSGHASTLAALNTYSLRLVDDEAFELGQTNFTPQFAKILNARPDVLFVWGTGAPAVVITRQWSDQCTGIPLMMTAAEASPLYVPPAGAAAEGVFVQATLGVIGRSLSTPNKYKETDR